MSPDTIVFATLALLVAMLVSGVQIAISLIVTGSLGLILLSGNENSALGLLRTTPFSTASTYEFTVIPLFILMGEFALYSGVSEGAYKALAKWMGKLPGGLAIGTVWACVAFGATSGSNIAAASVFTRVALPEMRKLGYEKNLSCACIAISSTLAQLVPPSIFLVLYAVVAEQSVSKMLMAGFIPGIVMASVLSIATYLIAVTRPNLAPSTLLVVTWQERFASLARAWPAIILAGIILGGIYSGSFTPTEVAAVGATVAFLMALGFRVLSWPRLKGALIQTASVTGMVFLILIGTLIFSRFLAVSGISNQAAQFIVALGLTPVLFLSLVAILYILMGCFVDTLTAMFITLPVLLPAAVALQIDLIWFGIVGVVTLLLGTITPPFGMAVFVVKAVAGDDVTVAGVFKSAIVYYLPMLLVILLLILFPEITLFLPNLLAKK